MQQKTRGLITGGAEVYAPHRQFLIKKSPEVSVSNIMNIAFYLC